MKRVLFDTNLILDVLLNRAPWAAEASALWQANDAGRLQGYLTATTLTNWFYIAQPPEIWTQMNADKRRGWVKVCPRSSAFICVQCTWPEPLQNG